MRTFLFNVLTLFVLFSASVNAQKSKMHMLTTDEAKMVKKDAATMFLSENYEGALVAYKDLYKVDSQNVDYNFKLGYCYLMTSVNKRQAMKHLEFATQSKDGKKEWLYFLGLAYMYNERFDDASKLFSEMQTSHIKFDKELETPERLIEICKNGKELTAHPVNCRFTNLGKTINTPFEEYNPFISADNRMLVFTSRRKGNMGGFIEDLGIFTADIFSSVWKDTVWAKARSMGANINTEWDEESVSLSAAGDQVFIYFDNTEAYADIGIATLKRKMWQKPVMFPAPINTKQIEGGATMSLDGNTVIFSSDRKEGLGKNDLWVVKKESGQWGNASNLKEINSEYEEKNPVLSLDGKTLYFASTGWNTMGGYDIFSSAWNDNEKQWSKPVNIGFPLNDADDNMFFSFSGNGRFAYVAAVRPGGFGDKDIYQVEFLDTVHHSFSQIISGTIGTASGRIEVTKVILENKNGSQVIYQPSSANNLFVMPATPGEYILRVEGYNFAPYSETLTVGNEFPPVEINKAIQLTTAK